MCNATQLLCRTMRRMRERYQEFGYDGLFDQRRRKRVILRVPMETAEQVLGLYRDVVTFLCVLLAVRLLSQPALAARSFLHPYTAQGVYPNAAVRAPSADGMAP